ncbi:hypothetical protein [Bdellovibrio bacteriovorus]|uniref:hypothetical protein n=1 Tax=Bdellovibrio bacteriovorus TaxID=959 RepID=UPI0035A683B7
MLEKFFLHQKQYSLKIRGESLASRIEALNELEKAIEAHRSEIIDALKKDFQKPEAETLLSEIYPVLKEIKFTKKHLAQWTKAKKVHTPLTLFGSKATSSPRLAACVC